ncbi:MAG: substrate-binding domain-containing protein [Defluviitaleaceae bacterium]|nr:substrate-binding domain-containing protein [Defluviitaleaceae bacterium]MCL2240356.1 substrate-binding domain-containing protein [Defluviitaleaceae bacterium]
MKKMLAFALLTVVGLLFFTACGDGGTATNPSTNPPAAATSPVAQPNPAPAAAPAPAAPAPATTTPITGPIDVISRESGSGTRDAFVDILGILEGGVDRTYIEAVIQTGTGAVITAVAGNLYSIGYISLGALRDDVRAMPINGVAPSAANVQAGTYPLFRTFYLAVPRNLESLAQDFLDFILSAEGQAIVSGRNYIAVGDNLAPFTGGGLTGTLEITGSTSIAPLMELLAVAYMEINDDARIEVHSSGSGAGITDAIEGRAAFGMVSRELRPTELESVDAVAMAYDGLAVIVHNDNPIPSLTTEQVRDIFMGELSRWGDTQ